MTAFGLRDFHETDVVYDKETETVFTITQIDAEWHDNDPQSGTVTLENYNTGEPQEIDAIEFDEEIKASHYIEVSDEALDNPSEITDQFLQTVFNLPDEKLMPLCIGPKSEIEGLENITDLKAAVSVSTTPQVNERDNKAASDTSAADADTDNDSADT